jgi:hypothetical protein
MIYHLGMLYMFSMEDLMNVIDLNSIYLPMEPSWNCASWDLLDRICRNRESWSIDLGDEGGIKTYYDCLRTF